MAKRVQTASHLLFIFGDFPFDDSDHAVYRSMPVRLFYFHCIALENFSGILAVLAFSQNGLLILDSGCSSAEFREQRKRYESARVIIIV